MKKITIAKCVVCDETIKLLPPSPLQCPTCSSLYLYKVTSKHYVLAVDGTKIFKRQNNTTKQQQK